MIIPHAAGSASLSPEHVFKHFIESFRGCSGFQNELRLWLFFFNVSPIKRKKEKKNHSGPFFSKLMWVLCCKKSCLSEKFLLFFSPGDSEISSKHFFFLLNANQKNVLFIYYNILYYVFMVSFTVFLYPPCLHHKYWCSLIWQLKRIEIESI